MVSDRTSDQSLIAALAAGDETAITSLYDRHVRLLWSLVSRIVRDPAEAEDVVQELFVRVWQQSLAYDPSRGEVKAWLCQMARTMAIDKLRASSSRATREQAYGERQGDDESLRQQVDGNDRDWASVRRCMRELPAEQRMLIEHAYFEGLSQSEMAKKFGIPLGTVKTRIRQGMIRLRERFAT